MASAPPVLCYWLSIDRRDSSYPRLLLHLFQADAHSVSTMIDDAPRNYSGDTAVKYASWFRSVRDRGHDKVFEPRSSSWGNTPSFVISWQFYDSDRDPSHRGYCDHSIESLGNMKLSSVRTSVALLDKIEKVAAKLAYAHRPFEDPRYILAALDKMKAVRVVRLDRSFSEPMTWVADLSPRIRLRSEGIVAMFGG